MIGLWSYVTDDGTTRIVTQLAVAESAPQYKVTEYTSNGYRHVRTYDELPCGAQPLGI